MPGWLLTGAAGFAIGLATALAMNHEYGGQPAVPKTIPTPQFVRGAATDKLDRLADEIDTLLTSRTRRRHRRFIGWTLASFGIGFVLWFVVAVFRVPANLRFPTNPDPEPNVPTTDRG